MSLLFISRDTMILKVRPSLLIFVNESCGIYVKQRTYTVSAIQACSSGGRYFINVGKLQPELGLLASAILFAKVCRCFRRVIFVC